MKRSRIRRGKRTAAWLDEAVRLFGVNGIGSSQPAQRSVTFATEQVRFPRYQISFVERRDGEPRFWQRASCYPSLSAHQRHKSVRADNRSLALFDIVCLLSFSLSRSSISSLAFFIDRYLLGAFSLYLRLSNGLKRFAKYACGADFTPQGLSVSCCTGKRQRRLARLGRAVAVRASGKPGCGV